MSYENTKCPCGGRKEENTMLCPDCKVSFAARPELSDYMDKRLNLDFRRNAAITLVMLAKRRVPRVESKRLRIDA